VINKNIFTKTLSAAAVVAGLSAIQVAEAANWLMLQGTERPGAAGRAKVWGFIQAQYQSDSSEPFAHPTQGDLYVPPKLIGPNLTSQEQFNVNRARIGVRGIGMPLDSTVNYFLLAELGNNGITAGNGGAAMISDASITINTDAVRIRAGLFKTPGVEEGLQAIHVFDYINFTTVTNQLMLERFPQTGEANTTAPDLTEGNPNSINNIARPVGAFRDTGVQFFQSYKMGKWDHSYAVMFGNGNGLNFGNTADGNMDTYLYWASELAMGGKGPRAQGLKIFAWNQSGKRLNPNGASIDDVQDRTRTGFGVKYLKMPFRVTFESMTGEGMIFKGPHQPVGNYNDLTASGSYIDFGYYIPNSKWEIDLRVDTYTRDENATAEATFDTTTVGLQYHINKKSRVNMTYDMRDFSSEVAAANNQLKGVGDRLAVQLTHIF